MARIKPAERQWYAQHLTGRDMIPGVQSDEEAIEFLNRNPKLAPDHVYEIVRIERTTIASRPHNSKGQFTSNAKVQSRNRTRD